jgi:hypothetical protein
MYLTSLASREQEINEILKEYNQIHIEDFPAKELDEVIENIEEIRSEKNVQLCKQLDQELLKF